MHTIISELTVYERFYCQILWYTCAIIVTDYAIKNCKWSPWLYKFFIIYDTYQMGYKSCRLKGAEVDPKYAGGPTYVLKVYFLEKVKNH